MPFWKLILNDKKQMPSVKSKKRGKRERMGLYLFLSRTQATCFRWIWGCYFLYLTIFILHPFTILSFKIPELPSLSLLHMRCLRPSLPSWLWISPTATRSMWSHWSLPSFVGEVSSKFMIFFFNLIIIPN